MTDASATSPASHDDALLRFLHLAGRLKETPRAGWALRGIAEPESVADHSHRVALLALVLAPRAGVDVARCVALALVHDLAEALVGDITPYDGVSGGEKQRREADAMRHLSELAGDPSLVSLWREYDAAASPEARFVKELDKLETVLQAAEYERGGHTAPGALDEFWHTAGARITSPVLCTILDALRHERSGDG